MSRQKIVKYTSPKGSSFKLPNIQENEYTRKHIGEVKENPTITTTASTGRKTTNTSSNSRSLTTKSLSNAGPTSSASSGTSSSSSSGVRTSRKTGSKIINQSADTFQDLGVAGRDIPLNIKFSGENHDLEANKFEKALCEIGKSKLQLHYGNEITVNVLEYTRKNNVVNDVSSTIFEVKFHETANTSYPDTPSSKIANVKQTVKIQNVANIQNMATAFNAINKKTSSYKQFMASFTNNLNMSAKMLEGVQDSKYLSIFYDIKSQMPFNNPLIMGTQIGLLYQSGLTAFSHASNILDICHGALTQLMPANPDYPTLVSNDFFAKSTIINTSQALVNSDILTRKETIQAAQRFQVINQNYQQYIDTQQANISSIDPVLASTLIQNTDVHSLVQNTAGALVEMSFDLKIERNIIIDEPTNLLQLAYTYYADDFKADPDGTVDYLIQTNNFNNDDFLFLDKGRNVLIYV